MFQGSVPEGQCFLGQETLCAKFYPGQCPVVLSSQQSNPFPHGSSGLQSAP